MWLDKIKSTAVAVGLAAFLAALAAGGGLAVVGKRHGAQLGDAYRFAVAQPLQRWPADLLGAAAITALIGFAAAAGLFALLHDMQWTKRPRRIDDETAAADLLSKSAKPGSARIFAGKFAGKQFYASVEDRGLVIGPPGTGKTAFLLNQILRASKNGLSFAAVDIKPELATILTPSLQSAGYRVLRINPAKPDADADHWNPLQETDDETEIAELVASLLPIETPRDKPFIEAQRDWLKAAVFHIKTQPGGNLPMAFDLLSSHADPLRVLDVLGKSESGTAARIARRIAAGLAGQKPDPLILQGLTGMLRSLEYLGLSGVRDALSHSTFSIAELGTGQPTALFLQFQESKMGALGPVLALMATSLLTGLINTAGNRAAVALFLDELGNMPPIPGLAEKLNTIRSRHMPTWMYFQTAQQIVTRYGAGMDATFFASADVQMVFRLNDVKTRADVATLVGTTEKEKRSTSISAGKASTSISRERVNVIEPHALGQLKPGEIVLMYRGAACKGRATPHFVDFQEFKRNEK